MQGYNLRELADRSTDGEVWELIGEYTKKLIKVADTGALVDVIVFGDCGTNNWPVHPSVWLSQARAVRPELALSNERNPLFRIKSVLKGGRSTNSMPGPWVFPTR